MTMSLNDALAEIVRERIETRGMTMASLARVSGVSRESIRNYIQRGRTMPIDVVAEIAPGLGLTAYELVRLAQERRDFHDIAFRLDESGDPDGPSE